MKKFNMYAGIVLVGSVLLVSACKKEEEHAHEADIQISAPVAGHTYEHGDTVFINAVITNTDAMHGWDVYLRKTADQAEVFTADAHDHAATYTISQYWVNNVTDHTEMELEVKATIDHDGNTQSKKVTFHCHP